MPTRLCRGFAVVPLLLVVAGSLSAQVIGNDNVEELAWDRPEAWAMKYFSSVSVLTGLGAPRDRAPWSFELGLEIDNIPSLSEDQRRIGFGGQKVEDINRLPVLVRPRLTVGLPGSFSLDVGWVPPVTLRGVRSNLFALGLERPIATAGSLTLGARLSAQVGSVKGDFTCSEDDIPNVWGCEAASKDELGLDNASIAFTGGYLVGKTTFHWGLAATYMDMEFQVDALTDGLRDRTLLLADGWSWSVNGGASWRLNDVTSWAVEIFYSPLSVNRPPSTASENDPLLNVRSMIRFTL